MKFFNWMHNKLNGRSQGNRRSSTAVSATRNDIDQEPSREEFCDWPQGLLAIGTFGNNDLKENPETSQDITETVPDPDPLLSDQDISDFTTEEVGKLQKELTKLLSRKPAIAAASNSSTSTKREIAHLPLDKFLNCPSSLDVDRRNSITFCSDSDDIDEQDIERTIRVILGKCKDVRLENHCKKAIGKKSVSFLLKKMFVCGSGFAPAPSLRDTFTPDSRMEKFLRTMLSKKIYPQNSSRASSMKKYIEDKQMPKKGKENQIQEITNNGCKWVKTDSEYIVLEI